MRLTNDEIEKLFRKHNSALNATARRTARTEDADDIVQSAYLRLLEMDNAAHVTNAKFYLFRIVSNMAIDWLRKQRAHASVFADELDGRFESSANGDASEERAILDEIRVHIAGLPDRTRDVFLLSHVGRFKQPEIASKLGVSLRTVSRDLNDARKRLQLISEQQSPKLDLDVRCERPSTEDSSCRKGLMERSDALQPTSISASHRISRMMPASRWSI